jgi:hypothetical protein
LDNNNLKRHKDSDNPLAVGPPEDFSVNQPNNNSNLKAASSAKKVLLLLEDFLANPHNLKHNHPVLEEVLANFQPTRLRHLFLVEQALPVGVPSDKLLLLVNLPNRLQQLGVCLDSSPKLLPNLQVELLDSRLILALAVPAVFFVKLLNLVLHKANLECNLNNNNNLRSNLAVASHSVSSSPKPLNLRQEVFLALRTRPQAFRVLVSLAKNRNLRNPNFSIHHSRLRERSASSPSVRHKALYLLAWQELVSVVPISIPRLNTLQRQARLENLTRTRKSPTSMTRDNLNRT